MNQNKDQNSDPNNQKVPNPFLYANTSFLSKFQNIDDLNKEHSLLNIIEEKSEIIKDENGSKIIEQKITSKSVPIKSLINEKSQLNIINPDFNMNNNINMFNNNMTTTNLNNYNNSKKNINNININNSLLNNDIFNQEKKSTYKIQLFSSKNKCEEKSLNQNLFNKVQIINLNQNKKENYKKLIKRIAMQLKLKIKPPTKGFFYNYLLAEKQKKYKILVKKIAIQLKKRIKFPTAKIFKIYESYILLIKRIAHALNISRKQKINNNINKEEKIIIDEENIVLNHINSKSSKKSKKLNYNITVFKKEDNYGENCLKISEDNININNKGENNQDLNNSQDLNISLSNIEVSKNNFINDFKNFLDKTNIQIINDLPISKNEKNKLYFKQNNFWILILNYLFYQNKKISLYSLMSLLEQYCLWCSDKNIENFNSIKELIKEYIKNNFSIDFINQFLFMNKLNNIDEIFEKFEKSIKYNLIKDYKEIKINDINLKNQCECECECELCKNDDACIKKVSNLNKNKIKIIKSENFDFIGKNEKIKNIEMGIGNGEEIYYRGMSEKKNNIFTKSKTRFSENTKFEYNYISHIDSNEKDKTFKNISKKKIKSDEMNEENEKKEEDKNKEEDIKEDNKEEEEEEPKQEKNKKKLKKLKRNKKIKKDKKYKIRNKYKKKPKNDEDDEESSDKEKNSDEDKEENNRKLKKTRKSNKSDNNNRDEDSEEKIEDKSRSSRTKINKKKKEENDDEDSLNNSNRKKSKTPKNKKYKK